MPTRPLTSALTRSLSGGVTGGGGASLGPFYGVMANPPTITITDTASTTIAGGTRIVANGNANMKYTGTPAMVWGTDSAFAVASNGGGATDIGSFVVWEFLSTAPQVEFLLIRFNSRLDIRVDGELIQSDMFNFDSAGSRRLVKLDWSADANPTKQRLYRVAGFNLPFGGGWVTAGGTISYPTARDSVPLMAFLGDSYTQSIGASGPDQVWANTLAVALGHDYWGDGLGGSGWNTATPNTPVERINKRIAIMPRTPDVIITALGYNDAGGNMVTLATNYDAAIALLKTEWPSATIISLGPWTPLGSSPNLEAVASAVSGRALANSVSFVDIANVVNATNKVTYTGGDNVHPTPEGHKYLGRTIAARAKPVL